MIVTRSTFYVTNALNSSKQKDVDNIAQWFDLLRDSQRVSLAISERRNSERIHYPLPVFLTPFDSKGELRIDESFGVIGRQLSPRGFDFFHRDPIPERQVVASFEYSPDRWLGMQLELNWCRFGRHGYFENGGEFVSVIDSPFGLGPIVGCSD